MTTKFLSVDKEAWFPNLKRSEYWVTSEETPNYNCIAHAAGKNDNWWWPDDPPAFWPDGLVKTESVQAFVEAYSTVGFVLCEDMNHHLEPGFEKIAIYVDANGIPSHAARQLPDGAWTSKLGEWEDIRHASLEAVEDANGLGLGYGKVTCIMKRPTT
jgi:hypothetical protein